MKKTFLSGCAGRVTRAVLLALFLPAAVQASTIAPSANLGELGRHSEAVVFARAASVETRLVGGTPWTYTEFHLIRHVGGAETTKAVTVAEPGGSAEGRSLTVGGTPDFAVGRDYLLFLDRDGAGRWRTRTLAWGVLEAFPGGHLAPMKAAHELAKVEVRPFEAPGVYHQDALLDHLAAVIAGADWNREKAGYVKAATAPKTHGLPGDCVLFTDDSTGNPQRWFGFDSGTSAEIFHSTPGQTGIGDGGLSAVQDGIDAWTPTNGTSTVRYDFGGTRASTHDCADNSAIEFGENNAIYNDPCDEISALNMCSGTLAIGGIFGFGSPTQYAGEPWHEVASPFVVVNDGTQCIGETAFKEMMTHELGHSLAQGHHTDADATMSANLKDDGRGASIKTTDRNCVAYSYGFFDVAFANSFWNSIEAIKYAGVTAGCGNGNYCPTAGVPREQMAVFLLKASQGSAYLPPSCSGDFNDVPCPSVFADWIEDLADRGITAGCGGGNYCPDQIVSREQMAVFLLKTLMGSGYTPPACSGTFGDVPCPSLFADWIEDLSDRGITGGCGGGNYCPGDPNTRGQMAVFLRRTFSLPAPP